jgi:hypothetical protein
MKIDGGCHCGFITYEAEADPAKAMICHCTDCQTLSGSAFRAVLLTQEGSFKLRTGKLKIYVKTGESGNERPQSFCPKCGTPIYSTTLGKGSKVHSLRLGTVRQRDEFIPKLQNRAHRMHGGWRPPRSQERFRRRSDRDGICSAAVRRRLRAMGIRDKPTAPGSPWLGTRRG